MRDDHEDDQQHQQNIDQRDHIYIGNDPVPAHNYAHAHESPRETKFPCEEDSHMPARNPNESYCPASSLAVIKPTLSMPAPRMTSIARATDMNSTSLSPLTNATFSARSLKICSMRGPRASQLASSLLILSLSPFRTWTTTV